MTLIYYTRANGEIRHAHKKPDKWTSTELEEKVANYNRALEAAISALRDLEE